MNPRVFRLRLRVGALIGAITLWYQILLPWLGSNSTAQTFLTPSQSELDDLLVQASARVDQLIADFDREQIFNTLGLDLGPSVTFNDYAASLNHAADDAFSFVDTSRRVPKPVRRAVQTARSAATLHSNSYNGSSYESNGGLMPHRIGSTIKNISEMPEQFQAWRTLNPDWEVTLFDDDVMEEWLHTRLIVPGAFGAQRTALLEEYDRLPRPILKSDFFRYLLVFFDGGLYTDSDTSCIHAISEWGNKGTTQDWTDPTLLALTNQAQSWGRPRGSPRPIPINEAPPALIISLESSVQTTSFAWQEQANTGGQVVQWTFGGKPGHPVLLDVIQRIIEVSREVDELRANGDMETWMRDEYVFFWTGPTVWSSAVWRYLWARWGFDFRRLNEITHPVRVGDVLIFPYASFQATFSELNVEQPLETCVWHGAFGFQRWRTPIPSGSEEL